MKNKLLLLFAALVLLSTTAFYLFKPSKTENIIPGIYSVSNNSAIITFESKAAYRAEIVFNFYLGDKKTQQRLKEENKTTAHKLYLQNLSPGTKYSYSFPNLSKREFYFKTKPDANQLFRFGIVPDLSGDEESVLSKLRYLFTKSPEFLIIMETAQYQNKISEIKPYLPIFDMQSYNSFNWGAWYFVILPENFKILQLEQDLKNNKLPNTFVCLDKKLLLNKELTHLLTLNKTTILSISPSEKDFSIIEADYYEATGVILDSEGKTIREFSVKESPAKIKKTCEYCRQLMDSGKYNDSIKAYREFIAEKKNSYQVDDAQYELASIYDRGLYDYRNALIEYTNLIKKFPDSTKKTLAENRISYLKENSDYDFKPLARYEDVKAQYFKTSKTIAGKTDSINKVEAILKEYPSCSLADDMLYWLANNYQDIDYKKSVEVYRKLIKDFPQSIYIQNAVLEIADVYYSNRQYNLAVSELKEAKSILPIENLGDINGKIAQSMRNIHRYWIAGLCWAIVLGSLLSILLLKPKITLSDFKTSGIHLLFYFVCFGIVVLLWFDLFSPLIPFIALAIPLLSAVPVISGLIAKQKLLLKIGLNVILTLCFLYIAIFYTYIHWLIVFGL
ncbi:MAG: hypothetical protein A3J83_00875 [Elusimicrobia bacterium RIFOXYA2_FULL_40_6]|nr:MAG: hypothetical protein A3J83_00875 [Elusimicrobia bacterium RIFOXYA2_FULL_40_6]